ncbi:MAG: TatD family hydrolase [Defluviitaleaceae bacterium]|nr:TatD family hydrolase [Defluviitaleaceae bacterium]
MYFDTHAHYDFGHFDADRQELLSKTLPEAGVSHVINIGINIPSAKKSIEYAKKYDHFYAAIGFHPMDCGEMEDGDIAILEGLAKEPKVISIGEIGLDYYHKTAPPKDLQKKCFMQHLDLAMKLNLPVIIHCRDAHEDVFEILAASGVGKKVGGVMHCYSGTPEMAVKYVEMGFHIGIGGVVTYKNAEALRETVRIVPKNRLLIETDCPFLPPEPHRGTRNDSRNLYYITEKIGEILGITHEEAAMLTCENAKRLFLEK